MGWANHLKCVVQLYTGAYDKNYACMWVEHGGIHGKRFWQCGLRSRLVHD